MVAKQETKHAVGRPTKYRSEYCKRVVDLSRDGLSVAELALDIGVARQTLYTWMDAHPEFLDAMSRARDYSLAWWERKAREGIVNEKGRAINAALWGKIMSARFPDDYRKRKEIEVSGHLGWEAFMREAGELEEGAPQ